MAKKKSPSIETNRRSRKKQMAAEKRAQFFLRKQKIGEKFIGQQKAKPPKSSSPTGRASQRG